MRFLWVVSGFLGVLGFCAQAAAADEPAARRFELGVHAGWQLSLRGDLGSGSSGVPVGLDFGYRATPNWVLAVSGEYGPESISSSTSDTEDRGSGHHLRATAWAHYHTRPERVVDPSWGVGAGYDRESYDDHQTGWGDPPKTVHFSAGGLVVGAQFGLGLNLAPAFAVTPFFEASFADHREISSDSADGQFWWMVGAKGTVRF